MVELKDKHELSIDAKMSSSMLETMYCAVCFWDGSAECAVECTEKSGGCYGLCVVKEGEMNLELNCSSGEGERRGRGGWEALQGSGAQILGMVSAWESTCLYSETRRRL